VLAQAVDTTRFSSYTPRAQQTNLPETITKHSDDDSGKSLSGRCVALDVGEKRIGVAISDELNISITALPAIQRTSWKRLLRETAEIIRHYDAKTLVIGLPLKLDNTEGSTAEEMRRTADKFRLSLTVPVFLQDEKLTTFAARQKLQELGYDEREIEARLDSEAAAIILRDFISTRKRQA
jgi:putative Holliday junction resolvase